MAALAGLAAALATLADAAPAAAAAEAPAVVASIKPVHALTAQVMAGIAVPQLLLSGAGSPHSYSLRPTDAALLQAADVIVWIGPGLEAFLARPLASLAHGAQSLELARAQGVQLLPVRRGGVWPPHADADHVDAAEPAEAAHAHPTPHTADAAHAGGAAADMHIWLDPRNAAAMLRAIAAALAAADPAHAEGYRANAATAAAALDGLDAELDAATAPVRDRRYVVFHDAYQYFEARYRLSPAGAITVSPEMPPGARRLAEVRATIRASGAVCVFSEPQFPPALVQTLIEGTPARTGTLDPIGVDLPRGPDAYAGLMRGLASSLRACLRAG
jgi:zinc transport system substrate-binding protein